MTTQDAIDFLKPAFKQPVGPQQWADLGCGSGKFSEALASLLSGESEILCLDRERQSFGGKVINGVTLAFEQGDFTTYPFGERTFDGFLMANSLHFVQDKRSILQKLKNQLAENGKLLIVEYDTSRGNQWVPYPITFEDLKVLCESTGIGTANKLNERASAFGGQMYVSEIILSS